MSVDVFGRQLDESVTVKYRAFPVNAATTGFKLTADGQYDMQNRRLCNVTDPENPSDAATLNILHKKLHNTVKILRHEINNSNLLLVQGLEANINNIIKTLTTDLETIKDLSIRNSNAILDIDTRLNVLEKKKHA